MSNRMDEIAGYVIGGRAKNVQAAVQQALSEGVSAETVLNDGLLNGMMQIGERFTKNEVFMPEVLVAARAMNLGIKLLEPELQKAKGKPVGRVVIGTVKGDMHDIGKNLVGIMLKGAGFEVTDIGVDADAETFLKAAQEARADIICMSSLLTTTMPYMEKVIKLLELSGVRERYIVMVGGAPVNEAFAKRIGADYYTEDAAACAKAALTAMKQKDNENV